mgnify:FL=1
MDNTLNRKLFNKTKPQERGIVGYAMGGEVGYAMGGEVMSQETTEQMSPEIAELGRNAMVGVANGVEQSEQALDSAETVDEVLSAIMGGQTTVDETRQDISKLIGQEDAYSTPESALMLIQPTLQLMKLAEESKQEQAGIRATGAEVPMMSEGIPTGGIGDINNPIAAPVMDAPEGFMPEQSFHMGGAVGHTHGQDVTSMGGGVAGIVADETPNSSYMGNRTGITNIQARPIEMSRVKDIQNQYVGQASQYAPADMTVEELRAERDAVYGGEKDSTELDAILALAQFGASVAQGKDLPTGISEGTQAALPMIQASVNNKRKREGSRNDAIYSARMQNIINQRAFKSDIGIEGLNQGFKVATEEAGSENVILRERMNNLAAYELAASKLTSRQMVIDDSEAVGGKREIMAWSDPSGNTYIRTPKGLVPIDQNGAILGDLSDVIDIKDPDPAGRIAIVNRETGKSWFSRLIHTDPTTGKPLKSMGPSAYEFEPQEVKRDANNNITSVTGSAYTQYIEQSSQHVDDMASAQVTDMRNSVFAREAMLEDGLEIISQEFAEIFGFEANLKDFSTTNLSGLIGEEYEYLRERMGEAGVKQFTRSMQKAWALSRRFPEGEQKRIADLLPNEEAWLEDPDAALAQFQELMRNNLNSLNRDKAILRGDGKGHTRILRPTTGSRNDPFVYNDPHDFNSINQMARRYNGLSARDQKTLMSPGFSGSSYVFLPKSMGGEGSPFQDLINNSDITQYNNQNGVLVNLEKLKGVFNILGGNK